MLPITCQNQWKSRWSDLELLRNVSKISDTLARDKSYKYRWYLAILDTLVRLTSAFDSTFCSIIEIIFSAPKCKKCQKLPETDQNEWKTRWNDFGTFEQFSVFVVQKCKK